MVDVDILRDTYLVVGLADGQIAQIAEIAELKTFASGQALARIGEEATELFVVIDGNAIVTTQDGDRLGEIGKGSLIGEIALVDARPRTANVVAIGAMAVVAIPIAPLRKLMNEHRDWGFVVLANISRVLAMRLRQADATIDALADKATDVWTHALG